MSKHVVLVCKQVSYGSPMDEDVFFEWISRIESIIKWDGIRDELYLYFKNKRINNQNLREIIALFYRYKIEMKQLVIFLNKDNEQWFQGNKKAYWHKRVFGSTKKSE